MSDSLRSHGLQHTAPLTFTISQNLFKFMSVEWCYLTTLSSAALLSFCLQCFPASGSFPMSQLFISGSQMIGAPASASVLPVNIQGWFPLGLTGWSLPVQGTLKSSPTPQFKSIHFLVLSLLYGPTLTFVHDYWENHSFNYVDFCRQSDVSAF